MLHKFTFEKEIVAFAIEINLRKVKWLLVSSYNPNVCNLPVHLNRHSHRQSYRVLFQNIG